MFREGRTAVRMVGVDFHKKNTNVIELYNLILKEVEDNQKTWYNSGIGTYAQPSWKSLKFYKKTLYHTIDLAIAWCAEWSFSRSHRLHLVYSGISNGRFWVHTAGCRIITFQAIVSFCLVCFNNMCAYLYQSRVMPRFLPRCISGPRAFSNDPQSAMHFVCLVHKLTSL